MLLTFRLVVVNISTTMNEPSNSACSADILNDSTASAKDGDI